MRIEGRALIPWLVGILVLVVVLTQTASALRQSGTWTGKPRSPAVQPADPYAPLERTLAQGTRALPAGLRNPLVFGGAPVAIVTRPVQHRTLPPPPPARPVLTSIIWDNDPRATVRWNDRDYSVRPGSLFADFRVVSISRDQVVLDKGGETLVLKLPRKGE